MLDFLNDIWQSKHFLSSQDNSAYDLHPEGADAMNEWVGEVNGVYYFSWSTQKSHVPLPHLPALFPGFKLGQHQDPDWNMDAVLKPFSVILGNYAPRLSHTVIDEAWFANDGVVNTCSMRGPRRPGTTFIDGSFSADPATAQPGRWVHMGTIPVDHGGIIGVSPFNNLDVRNEYRALARFLWSLR